MDFSGLRFGNITPTDIDGMIEYKDKAFVYIELKHRDAPCPYGQQTALKRQVDADERARKTAVAIIAEHEVDDPQEDVIASDCTTREIYFRGKWKPDGRKLGEVVKSFISYTDDER